MYQVARSETLAWTSGGIKNLPLDFMDRNGVRGMRGVIEKLIIKCILNITTVAANTIVGADMAGFIKTLQIKDAAGPRSYLTGAENRIFEHAEMFGGVFADPTTQGASATQNNTYVHIINFSQERTSLRPYDTAIPVDDFSRGGQIIIEMPNATGDLLQTGSGATINSGSYLVTALMREEAAVEFKARDQKESIDWTTQQSYLIPGNGRLLRAAYGFKVAQGGGTTWSGLTDFTIEPFKMISVDALSQRLAYLARDSVATQDPFTVTNQFAMPFVFPRLEAKIPDYLLVPGNIYIRTTSGLATPGRTLLHWIAAKDARIAQITIDDRNVKGNPSVKTYGGDKQDQAAWGDYAAFMPMEA